MPEVKLENIDKRYRGIVAVHELSLIVNNGEYFTILGPMGSGKTTTLMLIAGLIEPDEGEIYFDGKPMKGVPPEDRGVGFVFETFALFPHYNVYENVCYGPFVRGENPDSTRSIAEEMLEMVLLEDRPNALPDELSGGMKQRVALARALTSGAKILLLDEPLGALDAKIRASLANDLRKIVKELGLTAIHVTNSVEEAMTISDRIAIFNHGTLIQIGTPIEIYENPNSVFVMDIMGNVNLFTGKITQSSDDFTEVTTMEGFVLHSTKGTANLGASVHVVIRAEDSNITQRRTERTANRLSGIVKEKMFLLGFIKYLIELDNRKEIIIEISTTIIDRMWEVGEEVDVVFDPDKVFIFPLEELT